MINAVFGFWIFLCVSFFSGALAGSVSSPPVGKPPKPVHGISMFGDLKYPAGFLCFSVFNPQAKKGGDLHLHAIGKFDTLNPFLFKGMPAAGLGMYSYLPFDTLMERSPDESFAVYGRLAETVEMPEDRSWIIFNLRKEARFHDGSPVTAEDVLFTYECLKEHGSPTRKQLAKQVEKIEILSPHSIKFTFRKLDGRYNRELPLIIAMMPIISKKSLEGKSFAKTGMTPLMGSGPYRIVVEKLKPGQIIVYERVKDYWGKDLPVVQGLYNANTITYEYFSTEMVAFEAFKAGLLDLWEERDVTRLATGYTFPAVQKGLVIVKELPHRHAVGMTALVFNTRRALFQSKKVREALMYLLNFEWMNRNLFYGKYVRTNSFFDNTDFAAKGIPGAKERKILDELPDVGDEVYGELPVVPEINGSLSQREAIQKALSLLEEAGWVMEGQRGLINKKTGERFAFDILVNTPDREKIAGIFAQNLERLGIKATVKRADAAHYQKRLQDYDYDMIIHFWGVSSSPGIEQTLYWSSAVANVASRNYAGIRSRAIDVICRRIGELDTHEELLPYIHVLDRLLRHGAYVIPLFHRIQDAVAYWNWMKHPSLDTPLGLPTPYSWWIDGPVTTR